MLVTLQELAVAENGHPTENVQPPPKLDAKSTARTDVQLEMLGILHKIRQNNAGQGYRGGRGGRGSRGNENRNRKHRTPDSTNFSRRIMSFYCWTNGGCNHISGDCTRKLAGHNVTAAIDNHFGGSIAFCQPVQP